VLSLALSRMGVDLGFIGAARSMPLPP